MATTTSDTTGRHEVVEADPTATTVAAAFQATAAAHADAVAIRDPDDAETYTFAEYAQRVESIARGLAAVGVTRGDTVGILLLNRPVFHLIDTAAFHLGATPFSLYATSSPEQIAYLYENSGCDVLFTEQAFLPRALAAREAGGPAPSTIVLVDGAADGAITLEELEAKGDPSFDFEAAWRAVQPEDVLTLIYTSGTTGPPKGVELTHDAMLVHSRAAASVLGIRAGDTMTSYLPSAHAADRWASHYNGHIFGTQVTSISDPRAVVQVLPALRPSIWGSVPRIVEKMKAALEAGIAAMPDEQRVPTEGAIQFAIDRIRRIQSGEGTDEATEAKYRQLDEAIFSKLRAKFGLDRARWIVLGAAPLPRDVQEFLVGIGLPLVDLYGMSEATCMVSVASPEEGRFGTVGKPLPGLQTKLAEDGELLIKGPTVTKGYRNAPDKTAEAFTEDGWFHTGDIVEFDEDGYMRLVDRKKELIINAAGKNMSPANIESVLKGGSPLIGQVAVIGDRRRYNVALIVIDPDAAVAFANANGIEPTVAAVAADDRARQAIAAGVEAANQKLSRVEQIKKFEILADEWQPGGDELTPTMKLKRKPIDEKYADVIEALYAD